MGRSSKQGIGLKRVWVALQKRGLAGSSKKGVGRSSKEGFGSLSKKGSSGKNVKGLILSKIKDTRLCRTCIALGWNCAISSAM